MQHATLSTQPATLSIQVHALAKKHNLGHKSQGSEKAGTLTLTLALALTLTLALALAQTLAITLALTLTPALTL